MVIHLIIYRRAYSIVKKASSILFWFCIRRVTRVSMTWKTGWCGAISQKELLPISFVHMLPIDKSRSCNFRFVKPGFQKPYKKHSKEVNDLLPSSMREVNNCDSHLQAGGRWHQTQGEGYLDTTASLSPSISHWSAFASGCLMADQALGVKMVTVQSPHWWRNMWHLFLSQGVAPSWV